MTLGGQGQPLAPPPLLLDLRPLLVLAPLPLLPLARLFGRPSAAKRPRVVVARHEGASLGIVVDALLGARQAVIKPLSSQARGLPVFSGSSILGDGQVALMLDVAALVAQASARSRGSDKDSSYQRKEK